RLDAFLYAGCRIRRSHPAPAGCLLKVCKPFCDAGNDRTRLPLGGSQRLLVLRRRTGVRPGVVDDADRAGFVGRRRLCCASAGLALGPQRTTITYVAIRERRRGATALVSRFIFPAAGVDILSACKRTTCSASFSKSSTSGAACCASPAPGSGCWMGGTTQRISR